MESITVGKHTWLASVSISFVHDEQPLDVTINALTHSVDPKVTKKMLENLQVQAQIQLAKTLDNQLPDVKFVILNSISYLGCMTDEEFNGPAEPEE